MCVSYIYIAFRTELSNVLARTEKYDKCMNILRCGEEKIVEGRFLLLNIVMKALLNTLKCKLEIPDPWLWYGNEFHLGAIEFDGIQKLNGSRNFCSFKEDYQLSYEINR